MSSQNRWYENNKEWVSIIRKFYYEDNKKDMIEYSKQYRKDNLKNVKQKQRNWYIEKKTYTRCPCGSSYITHNKKNHEKTKKHEYFMTYNKIQEKKIKTYTKKNTKTKEYNKKPQEQEINIYKKIQIRKGFFKLVFS